MRQKCAVKALHFLLHFVALQRLRGNFALQPGKLQPQRRLLLIKIADQRRLRGKKRANARDRFRVMPALQQTDDFSECRVRARRRVHLRQRRLQGGQLQGKQRFIFQRHRRADNFQTF